MKASKYEALEGRSSSVGEFTASFGLLERLRRPETRLDVVPILDLLVLALLVSLLFTRFVMLPGVRVELPATDLRMQHEASSVAVLTIGNRGMLFFAGRVYEHGTVEAAFEQHVAAMRAADPDEAVVLLVKAQASMDLQLFLDLCEMAQAAGFDEVQVAGQKVDAVDDLAPLDLFQQGKRETFPVM